MRSRPLVLCALFGLVVACGGTVETENAVGSAPADVPLDPASTDVLPTGMYRSKVIAASCNVNDPYQRGDRMLVIRKATLANVPLPSTVVGSRTFTSVAPRQDWDLTRASTSFAMRQEEACPGGSITVSLAMTELTPTRIAFAYREEPLDCVHSACSVDFELELDDRACLPTTDPNCVPGFKKWEFARNATQEVVCECASP